jgi:hypothetical protein
MEDGAIMVNGVNVQHRVVVECNQDNDLALTLDLQMVVKSAMVGTFKSNFVIPT